MRCLCRWLRRLRGVAHVTGAEWVLLLLAATISFQLVTMAHLAERITALERCVLQPECAVEQFMPRLTPFKELES